MAALAELDDARAIGADLIRTAHLPADPTLLMLADRLGFAVWEEIPLYHATPLVFERTMARGIPQQMLREMALRDMNRPSVLFHGFANESTGTDERTDALAELHEVDRAIDGTRLTGQAAYGWQPEDPTPRPARRGRLHDVPRRLLRLRARPGHAPRAARGARGESRRSRSWRSSSGAGPTATSTRSASRSSSTRRTRRSSTSAPTGPAGS